MCVCDKRSDEMSMLSVELKVRQSESKHVVGGRFDSKIITRSGSDDSLPDNGVIHMWGSGGIAT
jgi:hypothetical protein